jgi:hypothetical protein
VSRYSSIVRARLILALLLVLPGFVLGPGWNLRICAGELFGLDTCCGTEVATSCCSDAGTSSEGPGWRGERRDPCASCCLDIDTSSEQLARTAASGGERELERAQLAALHVPTATHDPVPVASRPVRIPPGCAPSPPGRTVPLPLRI